MKKCLVLALCLILSPAFGQDATPRQKEICRKIAEKPLPPPPPRVDDSGACDIQSGGGRR